MSEQKTTEANVDSSLNQSPTGTSEVDWQDRYKRCLADYQNLQKQTVKEKSDFLNFANAALLGDLLPIYSQLKLVAAGATAGDNAWLEGLKLIVKQFSEVLTTAGVVEVDATGNFDHHNMEAIMERPAQSPELDGQVAQVIAAGYLLNGRLLLPAKVAVYRWQESTVAGDQTADSQN